MKKYTTPEMDIQKFAVEDVITTSGEIETPANPGCTQELERD